MWGSNLDTDMNEHAKSSTTPQGIRQINSIAALKELFSYGQLSRAELARLLGLNRSSSGSIIAELVERSLVREVPEPGQKPNVKGRSGRPGILLELEPLAAGFVGAEIGVEHISTLRIDFAANILDFKITDFDGRSTPVEDAVRQAVGQAFQDIPEDVIEHIEGFGLSAPAQMDLNGNVRIAPLLGWKSVDLAALARNSLPIDVPVMVENEANSFAFGESYTSSKKRAGVTLFLVMESGVGGGIVIDGRLFRGAHGLAGEIGHVFVRDSQELEHLLGLDRLLKCHQGVIKNGAATLDGFLKDVRDREPKAVEIAEEWAQDLARAVVAVSRLIDPDRIVLGGSVAALYPMVAARVTHYIIGLQPSTFPMPDIEVHDAPETGASYGAACMMHKRYLTGDLHRASDGLLE
jgi:predicted NBD/HSP70 family sugar kinase